MFDIPEEYAESKDEAISVRGYEALAKVIEENNPDGVVDTITKSGLISKFVSASKNILKASTFISGFISRILDLATSTLFFPSVDSSANN